MAAIDVPGRDHRAEPAAADDVGAEYLAEVEPDGYDAYCAWKGFGAQRRHMLRLSGDTRRRHTLRVEGE